MRSKRLLLAPLLLALCWGSARGSTQGQDCGADTDCLARLYAKPAAQWPAPTVDAGVQWQELGPRQALPAQPKALVQLGELLFHDRRLSRSQDISCASCHAPHLGFADGRRLALGHEGQAGKRNSPGLWGIAFVPQLMWDGRAPTLEAQALLPLLNPIEMAADLPSLLKRLNRETDYPQRFATVFDGQSMVTVERLSAALASFQRTLEAPRTRYDDFVEGKRDALTPQELRGLHLFRTKARCMNCHSGPQLTQHQFHQIGISFLGRSQEDLGRQAVTHKSEDLGAMRTPSLRGVSRTAPYMHQGVVPQLRGVLDLYNSGLPQPRRANNPIPPPSPLIQALKLTVEEVQAVEAFLRVL